MELDRIDDLRPIEVLTSEEIAMVELPDTPKRIILVVWEVEEVSNEPDS